MSTANDVFSVLEELSFPLKENANFDNLSLSEFSEILNWISKQMQFFAKTDSIVSIITDDADVDTLKMELNSLFQEVDSIYANSFTLESVDDRLSILHSLSGDLMAARLCYIKSQNDEDYSTELNPRKDLSTISNCLSIVDDMKNTKIYFQKIKEKLQTNVLKHHEEDSLLLPNKMTLTPKQWTELKRLNEAFRKEYSIRREMILRRADTTINSFSWKDDSSREVNQSLIKDVYKKCREKMTTAPCITLANALAARSSDCNALISEVISTSHANCIIEIPNVGKANQGAQQQLQLHKYLIGSVPDRGGRPGEQPMPAKETFSQQQGQRESANNRRGRGRGEGGNYQRNPSPRGNDRNSNYQPRNIPEHTNRIQNAGWQQGGGRGNNYQNYRQYEQHHQYESYSQYQGGHQRFVGYSNQNQYYPDYYQGRGNRGGGGQIRRY